MKKLISNLSIRHKVWGSLGLLVALMATLVGLSYVSLSGVDRKVGTVVDEIQPTVVRSMQLMAQLERSAGALGFYLLSRDDTHKQSYLAALKSAQTTLAALKETRLIAENEANLKLLNRIDQDVAKFASYHERLFELTENDAKNIPAIALSGQMLNPLSQQMLQNLSSMLQSEAMEEANAERKGILTDINDLRYAWANVMNGVRAYLAFRGKSSLDEVDLYKGETDRLLKKLQDRGDALTFDQADSLEQFAGLRDSFFANFKKVFEIHSSERWRTDAYLVRSEIGPLLSGIEDRLTTLVKSLGDRAATTGGELTDTMNSSLVTQLVLLVIGLLIGTLVLVGAGMFIVKPAQRLRDLLRDISEGEGDLTQRAGLDSEDELGQASRYFDNMMDSMQAMIRDIAEVSNAVHGRSGEASRETEAVTSNIAQGADRARSTAAATEQMSTTGAEIARSAAETADEAERVQQVSEDGSRRVQQMSAKAKDMGGQVDHLRRDVEDLSEKSKGMLDMVSIINDIANQTNLLALNAAIEAARAGDSGRGFAVVAEEVRQLAMKTQDSTSQITSLISDNLQSNENLALVMDKVSEATGSMLESVNETAQAITTMGDGIKLMSGKAGHIATAAKEQSVATDEVAGNIESISAMESENATRTGQVAAHLQELSELSSRLDTLVGRFKV